MIGRWTIYKPNFCRKDLDYQNARQREREFMGMGLEELINELSSARSCEVYVKLPSCCGNTFEEFDWENPTAQRDENGMISIGTEADGGYKVSDRDKIAKDTGVNAYIIEKDDKTVLKLTLKI
ncbi:MAG: hypothetical protein N3B21_17305 [Clostridia bacterium]|nr:hypothetical protein [Clostridia bacterium]